MSTTSTTIVSFLIFLNFFFLAISANFSSKVSHALSNQFDAEKAPFAWTKAAQQKNAHATVCASVQTSHDFLWRESVAATVIICTKPGNGKKLLIDQILIPVPLSF